MYYEKEFYFYFRATGQNVASQSILKALSLPNNTICLSLNDNINKAARDFLLILQIIWSNLLLNLL